MYIENFSVAVESAALDIITAETMGSTVAEEGIMEKAAKMGETLLKTIIKLIDQLLQFIKEVGIMAADLFKAKMEAIKQRNKVAKNESEKKSNNSSSDSNDDNDVQEDMDEKLDEIREDIKSVPSTDSFMSCLQLDAEPATEGVIGGVRRLVNRFIKKTPVYLEESTSEPFLKALAQAVRESREPVQQAKKDCYTILDDLTIVSEEFKADVEEYGNEGSLTNSIAKKKNMDLKINENRGKSNVNIIQTKYAHIRKCYNAWRENNPGFVIVIKNKEPYDRDLAEFKTLLTNARKIADNTRSFNASYQMAQTEKDKIVFKATNRICTSAKLLINVIEKCTAITQYILCMS